MSYKQESKAISLSVTDGLTVTVLPNSIHEFLIPTRDVAKGYGVSDCTIRRHKSDHCDELIEGKHFISGVSIPHAANAGSSIVTVWTKAGIIRLGFFIKSERAKLFRDWAENLILAVVGHKSAKALPAPNKRRDNRLSQDRLINIMTDVCQIEDKELRVRITNKLIGGYDYGTL